MLRQKGSALLLALLIMALITSIAVVTSDYLQRSLLRNQTLQWQTEAKWALSGNETVILAQLEKYLPLSNAIHRPGNIADMTIEYRLRDLGRCFNLNTLRQAPPAKTSAADAAAPSAAGKQPVDVAAPQSGEQDDSDEADKSDEAGEKASPAMTDKAYPARAFIQLVINVTGLSQEAAEQLTRRIADWVKPTSSLTQQGNGAAALLDISELRAITQLTAADYQQLKPWLCVLPQTRLEVNINALDESHAPLLSALTLGQLSVSDAVRLLNSRPAQGWEQPSAIASWMSENHLPAAENTESLFVLTSRYYWLSQWATREEQHYALHSLIYVDKQSAQVIQRKYGISAID